MPRINVLLTSELSAGMGPFRHDGLEVVFHRWSSGTELPLLDGIVWAFVDWTGGDFTGLELCRRLRCNPLTARAHITMVLDNADPDSSRRALRNGADDATNAVVYYGNPAVEVNQSGTMAVVYTRSGETVFPEARYSVYFASEPDLRPSAILHAGSFPFGNWRMLT